MMAGSARKSLLRPAHSPRTFARMSTSAGAPSQEQIEAAIQQTLVGWCAELDTGRKFWWGDWNRMIRDVITALRTGEPVLYDDDE